ncbi:MAG TPA: helix-hairpin-helix domain-containing protein [Gemmataceae bacterium]|nr:helix-hairpin-helix domain-containing protein [Gemmataceae bacterium]
MDNTIIAHKLNDYATYLEGEESNVYRVRAYRRAAMTVLAQERSLADVVNEKGRAGLEELPGIGASLAYTIEGLVRTGEFRTQRPDAGHVDPERLLTSLPGVGRQLAHTLHEELGITTLEEMERAAHDGRLTRAGVGPKRLRGLIDALAGRLRRSRLPEPIQGEPSVATLLAIDEEYRRQADSDTLPTLTPRRFNPEHEPWLPLFVSDRDGWRCRALFSNTALAHRLGKTNDWVVISFHDGFNSSQRTVVTETRGDLRGFRVVRGRERECRAYYREHAPAPTGPGSAA